MLQVAPRIAGALSRSACSERRISAPTPCITRPCPGLQLINRQGPVARSLSGFAGSVGGAQYERIAFAAAPELKVRAEAAISQGVTLHNGGATVRVSAPLAPFRHQCRLSFVPIRSLVVSARPWDAQMRRTRPTPGVGALREWRATAAEGQCQGDRARQRGRRVGRDPRRGGS